MNKKTNVKIAKTSKIKKLIVCLNSMILAFLIKFKNVYAGGKLQSSSLFKGTQKLLQDASNALLVLAPFVAGVVGIYFGIRLSMADEQDKKTWANRLKVLGVGFVITITITALISVISGYYGG